MTTTTGHLEPTVQKKLAHRNTWAPPGPVATITSVWGAFFTLPVLEGVLAAPRVRNMGTAPVSFLGVSEACLQSPRVSGLKGSKGPRPQSIFVTRGSSSGGFMRLFELHLTPVHRSPAGDLWPPGPSLHSTAQLGIHLTFKGSTCAVQGRMPPSFFSPILLPCRLNKHYSIARVT